MTNLQQYQKYLGAAPAASETFYVNPNVYLAGTGASSSLAALTTASGGLCQAPLRFPRVPSPRPFQLPELQHGPSLRRLLHL